MTTLGGKFMEHQSQQFEKDKPILVSQSHMRAILVVEVKQAS
jgi:hypothetical protein